jgi:predicted RNA-binding Zn-ribbon protein involved in translation (DUF1610 family)
MSDPQISRRCPSCGVSIRERAFFCPQCGNTLSSETGDTVRDLNQTIPDSQARPTMPLDPTAPLNSPMDLPTQPLRRAGGNAPEYGAKHRIQSTTAIHRKTANGLQKVEKIRRISSVVLDEAAYDPSLRFVLVAAALFIIFLTILIMSKLIG